MGSENNKFKQGDQIWFVNKSGLELESGIFLRVLSEDEKSFCLGVANYLVVNAFGGVTSAQFVFGQDSNLALMDSKMDELVDQFLAGESAVFPRFAPYKPTFEQIGKMVTVCYGSVSDLDKLGACVDAICIGLDDDEFYRGEELELVKDI
jgi:hypothetical protein